MALNISAYSGDPSAESEDILLLDEDGLYGLSYFYLLAAVNLLICFTGTIGNVLVVYVIMRYSSLQTVTNIFILALAFADITLLVNAPSLVVTSIVGEWWFGNIYCKIYYTATTINQFASSFLLVAMSADRFVAVSFPVRSRRIRTRKVAFGSCVFAYALSMALMYPVFMYSGTETSEAGITQCNIIWPTMDECDGPRGFALYCFILGFALPVYLMMIFYGFVIRKMRLRNAKLAEAKRPTVQLARRQAKLRRVTKMVLAVIAVYVLCWSPYWILQFFIVFGTDQPGETSLEIVYICLTLQCLCFANSAVNPFLYAALHRDFKKSFKRAFSCLQQEAASASPQAVSQCDTQKPEDTQPFDDAANLGSFARLSWITTDVLSEVHKGKLALL